jgi:hypothetical protein
MFGLNPIQIFSKTDCFIKCLTFLRSEFLYFRPPPVHSCRSFHRLLTSPFGRLSLNKQIEKGPLNHWEGHDVCETTSICPSCTPHDCVNANRMVAWQLPSRFLLDLLQMNHRFTYPWVFRVNNCARLVNIASESTKPFIFTTLQGVPEYEWLQQMEPEGGQMICCPSERM